MSKEDYIWYKSHGICPRCKVNDAFGNHVHCAECLEKINLKNLQTRKKNNGDIYSRRYVQKKKELYRKRKESGLCPRCGKEATHGRYCLKHHIKNIERNERRRKNRAIGEAFRERMAAGMCMYCENPQVDGYKFCEKHLPKKQEHAKAMGMMKGYAREEVDRQWKIAKLKHSKSI